PLWTASTGCTPAWRASSSSPPIVRSPPPASMRSRILLAWLDTRRRMRASEAALARHRNRLWTRLQPTLARTPALAGLAGRELADVPVVTPAEIRADYGRWN